LALLVLRLLLLLVSLQVSVPGERLVPKAVNRQRLPSTVQLEELAPPVFPELLVLELESGEGSSARELAAKAVIPHHPLVGSLVAG